MKINTKRIIAFGLTAVMALSSVPVFAASEGSVSTDLTKGVDELQNAKTTYVETVENVDTEVYLSVDDSDILVGVPTVLILNGVAEKDGEYKGKNIGEYQLSVSGDIAGDEVINVEPSKYDIKFGQLGKNNTSATIAQDKTVFTSGEIANGTVTDGTIIAQNLTAGSWSSEFKWIISKSKDPYFTTPKIEYFTWGPDTEFVEAYNKGDISAWQGLTEGKTETTTSYSYPSATGITGLTDAGIQWLKDNGGNLILPDCATEISDYTGSSKTAAFSRWNGTYGHEVNDIIRNIDFADSITYVGKAAFAGLEHVKELNTNQVKQLAFASFLSFTGCEVVDFNNVLSDVGKSAFALAWNVESVIGTTNVNNIQQAAFNCCYNLCEVEPLVNCTSIGNSAFYFAFGLESIGSSNELSNLQSIGVGAFYHTSVKYKSSDFKNCSIGDDAFPLDWSIPNASYTYTPCVNKIVGFSQCNDAWENMKIANTNKVYASAGCGWCVDATVYNYFYGTNWTPVDLVDYVKSIDPSFVSNGNHNANDMVSICQKVYGLKAVKYGNSYTTNLTTYQPIFDTLANGGLVTITFDNPGHVKNYHAVVVYGVTEDGKLMCADSDHMLYLNGEPDYQAISEDAGYYVLPVESLLKATDMYHCITK